MKFRLLLILIVLFLTNCKDSSDDKSKRNENWVWWIDAKTGKSQWIPMHGDGSAVKDGQYTFFYFNGKVYKTGRLVDGKDVDTIVYYNLKGEKNQAIAIRDKGDSVKYFYKNGPFKMLYASGKLESVGIVKNHTYSNTWKAYFQNGNINFLIKPDTSTDNSWTTSYYENGNIKDSSYTYNNQIYKVKSWYEDGQIASYGKFKNGSYNGKSEQYFRDGKLKASGFYLNGKIDGKEEFWYENGKPHAISYHKNGILDGPQTIYYVNGMIQTLATAKAGKLNGEFKQFDEQGKLITTKYFKDGLPASN